MSGCEGIQSSPLECEVFARGWVLFTLKVGFVCSYNLYVLPLLDLYPGITSNSPDCRRRTVGSRKIEVVKVRVVDIVVGRHCSAKEEDNSHPHPPPTEEVLLTAAGSDSKSSMPLHNEGLSKNDIEQQQLTPLSKSIMEPSSPAENDTKPPPSMHQPLHLASSTENTTSIMKGDMNNVASVSFFTIFILILMGCLLVLLYYPSFLYFVSGEISKYICGDW